MGLRRRHTPCCAQHLPTTTSVHLPAAAWIKCPCTHKRPTHPLCSASHPTHLSKVLAPTVYPFFFDLSLPNLPLPAASKHVLPSSLFQIFLPHLRLPAPFCFLVSALTSSFPSNRASAEPLKSHSFHPDHSNGHFYAHSHPPPPTS